MADFGHDQGEVKGRINVLGPRFSPGVDNTQDSSFDPLMGHDGGLDDKTIVLQGRETGYGIGQGRDVLAGGHGGDAHWRDGPIGQAHIQVSAFHLQKTRYSAFIQDSSDLPERLVAQGYDTVIIVGTVTNVCCESSARDAMMLNFRTIMVSDANAANSDEEHNASLIAFYLTFGDVMSTDVLITCLERNARHTNVA